MDYTFANDPNKVQVTSFDQMQQQVVIPNVSETVTNIHVLSDRMSFLIYINFCFIKLLLVFLIYVDINNCLFFTNDSIVEDHWKYIQLCGTVVKALTSQLKVPGSVPSSYGRFY